VWPGTAWNRRARSCETALKQTLQIDRANLRILQALQKNCKMSFHELSEAVNLSPSPCFFRVRKLEQAGVIRSYHTHIDLERLGPHVMIMTEITLERHTPQFHDKFQQYLVDVPEVVIAYMVSGHFDYLLQFVCKDIERYMALTQAMSDANIGISHLTSYVILGTSKPFSGYPLAELVAG
jgi:DNA-binding Lrp family transcriptional regulator